MASPSEVAIARHVIAISDRLDTLDVLVQILAVHVQKERQEIVALRCALADFGEQNQNRVASGEITPDMLER